MALENFGGFETGDLACESTALGTTQSVQTTVKRTGNYALRCNPTTTATGFFSFTRPAVTGGTNVASLAAAIISLRTWFRYATKPSANNEQIMSALTGAQTMSVRIKSDGILALYDGTTLVATGTVALSADTWYLIEFLFNDTANTQEVKLNGAVELSGSASTGADYSICTLGKGINRNGETVDFFYDDWAIQDEGGYPPSGKCLLSLPIGNGADTGWNNGSPTDTFAEVDDMPNTDDDTTYIQASATEDDENRTFDMQASATIGITNTIHAVKWLVRCKTGSVVGTSTVSLRYGVPSAGMAETTAIELTTSYQTISYVKLTVPTSGDAWTTALYDAAECGMAANAIAQTQRFTVAYLQAWVEDITAALTGTITASVTEADIVAGGKTLIITLINGATWIASGAGSFDLQRDEIIAGCDSAQSELLGWDLKVKALQSLAGVVRTSNTVVTITWDAEALYNITAQEVITVTVPSTAIVGIAQSIVATPTFTVDVVAGGFTAEVDSVLAKLTANINVSQRDLVTITSTLAKLLFSGTLSQPESLHITSTLIKVASNINVSHRQLVEVDSTLVKVGSSINLSTGQLVTIDSDLAKVTFSGTLAQPYTTTVVASLAKLTASLNMSHRQLIEIDAVLAHVTASLNLAQRYELAIDSDLARVAASLNLEQRDLLTIVATLAKVTASLNADQQFGLHLASTLIKVSSGFNLEQRDLLTIASTIRPVGASLNVAVPLALHIASILRPVTASLNASQRYQMTIAATLAHVTIALLLAQLDRLGHFGAARPWRRRTAPVAIRTRPVSRE